MRFMKAFFVLLFKDFLVALRSPVWTAFQLGVPIALGILLANNANSWKYSSEWRRRKRNALDDYERYRKLLSMGPTRKLDPSICSKCELYYVNAGPNRDAIQEVIDRVPWKEKKEFPSKEELFKYLDTEETDGPFTKRISSVSMGIEFETLDGDNFIYHEHSIRHDRGLISYGEIPKKPASPVFTSTDFTGYNLIESNTITVLLEKVGYIQVCLIAAKENKINESESLFEYQESGVSIYEDRLLRMVLKLLSSEYLHILGPILICTATTIATEKETGMQDFLVVMGLRKITLFLECLVFSTFKVLIVIVITTATVVVYLPSYVLPVFILSTLLLSLSVVCIAMLCAAVVKTSNSALILSTITFFILLFIHYHASNVFEPGFLHSILLFNPLAAYQNFLAGVRICYLRGEEKIAAALFIYDDIVNVGVSLLFLILDVVAPMVLVLLLDYVSIKPFLASLMGIVVNVNEKQESSEYGEDSWHQQNQGIGKTALTVDSVTKVWETTGEVAVKQFSMKAHRGQVTVLLGHNGAGKSTIYSMICGLTRVTKGNITVLGEPLVNGVCADRPCLGFCPQSNCIYDCLTVENHLRLFFILNGGEGYWHDEAEILCTQLGLTTLMKKKAGKLSGGEKRKLCVAMAFIGGNELVMLDEPTVGMDPQSRILVRKLIEEKKKTRAIVLTTHYLEEAEAMGDFLYIMQMGRCVCSGTPYFLKAKFAPELILTVVFKQNARKSDVETAKKVICKTINGAKMGAMNGKQVRFKLPRSQQKMIPELFAKLENKKALHIENFGLSTKALEEAFLQIAHIKGVKNQESTDTFIQDENISALQKDRFAKVLQQMHYILLKKSFDTMHNISLIVNQWILPIALVAFIIVAVYEAPPGEQALHVPDMSLNRVRNGRFLIFDPSNNRNRREVVEKALLKYPHIQVLRFNSSDHSKLWPRTYPWAVGGVLIRSEREQSEGAKPYKWLAAGYIHRYEEIFFHLVSDVEFAAGQLQLRVSYTETITARPSKNENSFLMAGFIFFFTFVLLNVSLVTSSVEERVSNFRHQQILAGLHPLVYWTTTMMLDTCVVVLITIILVLVYTVFRGSVKFLLMLYASVFNISMIPFVYSVSLFFNGKGIAKCVCIAYEVCTAIALTELQRSTDITLLAKLFPSAEFFFAVVDELADSNISKRTMDLEETLFFFSMQGLLFMALLYFCESHSGSFIFNTVSKTRYIEKSDVPDGQDVIEERSLVEEDTSEFALAVKDLTKYYGTYCAIKRTTYGIRAEDCFGLVGASGAGKTSTFDIITGLRLADDGSVFIGSQFVNSTQRIGYCPQFDAMLPHLSCRQNMLIIAGIIGYRKPELIVDEMLRFLNLTKHCRKAFGSCSGGQRRRVSIGVALLNPSKLVILDEPTAGLDPEARHHIWSLLKSMRVNGRALFLSSHSMEECEALCSRIGILVKGRLVAIGPSQALKSRYANNLFLHVILKSLKIRKIVETKVLEMFPSGQLVTKRKDSLELKFKIYRGHREKISELYKKVQEMASKLPIRDFFFLQSSLEDVLEILNEKYSGKIL